MKAIRYEDFGPPACMSMVELPVPECGPNDVLVHLRAASVIPGDAKLRAGKLKAIFPVRLPKIPGRDGAGVVAAVGSDVHDLSVGDHVCVVSQHMEAGTYAQAIVRDRGSVVPMPAGLTFEEGAALMHAGVCAWISIVEVARVLPGMKVLVHAGAGAIGGAAIQIARHLGAQVITTCSAGNIEYVKSLGAHQAIAYELADFRQESGKVDVVLDLLGGEVHRHSYDVLKAGGHMVCLMALPFENRSEECGVRLTMVPIHDEPHALAAVADLANQGVLKPQVAEVLPLDQATEAHRRIESREVSRGRIVLRISPISQI